MFVRQAINQKYLRYGQTALLWVTQTAVVLLAYEMKEKFPPNRSIVIANLAVTDCGKPSALQSRDIEVKAVGLNRIFPRKINYTGKSIKRTT